MPLLAFNLALFCMTLTVISFIIFGVVFVVRGFIKDTEGHIDGGKVTRGFVLFTLGIILTPLFCNGLFSAFASEAESGADFLPGFGFVALIFWPIVVFLGAGVIVFYITYGLYMVRTGNRITRIGVRTDIDTTAFGYMILTFGGLFILSIFILIIGFTFRI